MKKHLFIFVVRWLFNSLGLWIAVRLLGTGYDYSQTSSIVIGFLTAGLIFSVVNTVVKPIIVILSLPAILLTLGLFMIIVNGFMVYISLSLTGISMSFFPAIITGILLSLVNYIVSATLVVSGNKDI